VKAIRIGKITGAVGMRGEVSLWHDSGDEESLRRLPALFLSADAREPYAVERLRYRKRAPIVKLRGVEDRSAAEALAGREVWADEDAARPAAQDGWLVSDLVGLEARGARDGARLGRVSDVISNPAHDLLEIEAAAACGGGKTLLPMVDVFVKRVDLRAGVIWLEPPEPMPDD